MSVGVTPWDSDLNAETGTRVKLQDAAAYPSTVHIGLGFVGAPREELKRELLWGHYGDVSAYGVSGNISIFSCHHLFYHFQAFHCQNQVVVLCFSSFVFLRSFFFLAEIDLLRLFWEDSGSYNTTVLNTNK